jgi:peptide deformylase
MFLKDDKSMLYEKCEKCAHVTEGLVVGERLLKILKESKDAVGLAANQVGINTSVCVVHVTKPIVLVNPEIIGKFGKSYFQEGCLSFPGDYIMTERWTNIIVKASNHSNPLVFSFDTNALECVCVQHEIDHLNGVTMFDRAIDMELINGEEE